MLQAGNHFTLAAWADFVRGLLEAPRRAELQRHLDDGCASCLAVAGWMQEVAKQAAQPAPEPPAEVLENARAIFASRVRSLPSRVARLVYDSLRDPQPVGIRALPTAGRQALFETGDYCVDVRMEREGGSSRVALTGQIANSKEPDRPLANLPVLLLQGEKVILQAKTNALGEFSLEYQKQKNLRISIPLEEWSIVIRLNDLQKGD